MDSDGIHCVGEVEETSNMFSVGVQLKISDIFSNNLVKYWVGYGHNY